MALPDAVLAFKLLDTACLDKENRQLSLTVCTELTFSSMKSALKRIFGRNMAVSSQGIQLIPDTAFFTEQRQGKVKVHNVSKWTTKATAARYQPTG